MKIAELTIPDAKILIVDDIESNIHLLSLMLIQAGYTVQTAQDGHSALKLTQQSLPDLILLDIMMPGMDGHEVCRQLKANPRTHDIPVIFISALDEVYDKVRSFEVGGIDHITKPFNTYEVLVRVGTHLKIHHLQNRLIEKIAELDAFAHTVAHDLKNPVSIILGYAQLLETTATPEQKDFIDGVIQGGERMGNIIQSLLLLASVSKEDVSHDRLLMAQIVKHAITRVRNLVESYQATIHFPKQWLIAEGYAPWIEEVWVNYLSNAIKYGGNPPIVELGSTDLDNGYIRFWAKDNGGGILPEQQVLLFREFSRLNNMRVDGHGLGLSIVRRIMNKLDGNYGVESQRGEGSTFYFDLPKPTKTFEVDMETDDVSLS